MRIQVTRRIAPSHWQHRYILKRDGQRRVTGDILPDVMRDCPPWAFPVIDAALVSLRDKRPWKTTDETITLTIEIK